MALVQFRVNVCFYRRMVFWALCRQDCGPKLGSGYYFFGQRSDVELIFLNLLCQLYAADRHSRGLELLESERRPDSPFYPAVVLLDYVVQVFRGANPYPARKRSNLFEFGHRPMRGGVAVQRYGGSMLFRRTGKEPLGGRYITPFA